MEQLKTIVVIQTSHVLIWQIQPTQIKSWPRHIHVASVVRARDWTGFFGNPTAEFRRLKESIRFRTSRPVPRSKESPLLRVCAIKDWLPSHDVYFGLSVRTYMFRDKLEYIPCSKSTMCTVWWSHGNIRTKSGLEWTWCLVGDDRNVAKVWQFWWRGAKW